MTKAKSTTSSSSSSSSSTSPASSTASSKNKVKKVTKKKAAKKKSPATKSKAKAKPKTKKLVGNALSSAVTTYLTASNRPHSEKEVWENMHKPTAQSKMKLLLVKMSKGDDATIQHLANGKFNVFWANQAQYDEFTPEMIKNLETEGNDKRLQLVELKEDSDILNKQINKLKGRSTLENLKLEQISITDALKVAQDKATALTAGGAQPVDPKARDKLIKLGKSHLMLWKKRRDCFIDAIDQMSEGMGKKPIKICQDMDLETTIGANPKPYKEIKARYDTMTKAMQGSSSTKGSGTKRKK